jgi:hypothetical protein
MHPFMSFINPEYLATMMESMKVGETPLAEKMSTNFKPVAESVEDMTSSINIELEAAKKRIAKEKSLPPKKAKMEDPISMLVQGNMLAAQSKKRMDEAQTGKGNHALLKYSFCGTDKPCSSAKLEDLTRSKSQNTPLQQHAMPFLRARRVCNCQSNCFMVVDFKDLYIRKVHRGNYVLCRVISRPQYLIGITVMVASPCGDAMVLGVYNYPILPLSLGSPTYEDVQAAFPMDMIFAIKEPMVKKSEFSENSLIRVDSPTDIVVLDFNHPFVRNTTWKWGYGIWRPPITEILSFEEWKSLGNAVSPLPTRAFNSCFYH